MKKLSFLVLIACFFACTKKESYPDVSKIKASGQIIRFDEQMMAAKSPEELAALFSKYPDYVELFLKQNPKDKALAASIFAFNQNPSLQQFWLESQKQNTEVKDIEMQFSEAFKHIKSYYPTWKEPKILATFTGLGNDIFVSDSLVVVSLEAFLGPKASFRPQQPDYILKRYDRPYIVPQIIHFFAKRFVKIDPKDRTLLADMVFHGKANEFVVEMMPGIADTLINGFSKKQMDETWQAQNLVYAHFIDKKLMFVEEPAIKEKYLGERPITQEIGSGCPGRIGDWLGWRILGKYRTENPEVSLKEWMENPNAKEIFEKSRYRGEIDKE